jgi:hypothetical protein
MKDVSVLFVETSFDESLSPALYGSGLQGILRALVLDVRRTYDIVILTPSGDEQKFERLNHPRDQEWFKVILYKFNSESYSKRRGWRLWCLRTQGALRPARNSSRCDAAPVR